MRYQAHSMSPPGYSQATSPVASSSAKRRFKEVYNPCADEQFPDLPWYGLNYQDIIGTVTGMLNEIIVALRRYAPTDAGIKALLEEAEKAKNFPDLEKCFMAVLGEQASGKSTLLTALMGGRNLLERSGDTKSCTAVPTVIMHKKGADDNARESDITIEWLSGEEMLSHVMEQIRHWTDVYPGTDPLQDQIENAAHEEIDSSNDEDFEDTDVEESDPQVPAKLTSKLRKTLQKDDAASTAKEFFDVIFNTTQDKDAEEELHGRLYTTDIRLEGFADLCISKVKALFKDMDVKLRVRDYISEFPGTLDGDLREVRQLVKKLWPFIKIVTIATGHILLRYGMCFYDLPGFGDTNQLREANINRYRWQADLELIVATSSRIRTNKTLNKQLARSIHLTRGNGRTILVMNKTDMLLDRKNTSDQIYGIREQPFLSLNERFTKLTKELDDDHNEDMTVFDRYDDLMNEITVAYVKRETRLVQEHLREKGVAVFAASATSFLEWKNRMRTQDPSLSPEASGIPALIRQLLITPASTNFQNYQNHVTRVLERFRARAARVLEKHVEDQHYARMRKDLATQIPALKKQLKDVLPKLLEKFIADPWSNSDKSTIVESIEDLFKNLWKWPEIEYNGWRKMLRETGNPSSGVYHDRGRNLNEDVLRTVEPNFDGWANTMSGRIEGLAKDLHQFCRNFLEVTRANLEICTATPELKDATAGALDEVDEAIRRAYDKLQSHLNASLDENHLRFTTEIDIECPIAQAMKPSYVRTLNPKFAVGGKGVYNRQRKVLQTSMLNPRKHYVKLAKKEPRIQPLLDVWRKDCNAFIDEVMKELQNFSKTTEELLMDAEFMSKNHQKARAVLKRLLVSFDDRLGEVQSEFTNVERQPPRKKVKVEADRQTPTASLPNGGAGAPAALVFSWHKGTCLPPSHNV